MFLNKELFLMNNKTIIIELGFNSYHMKIMEILEGVICLEASTDNSLLDFHNSS